MKRFWILMAGAIPLALATPADAGQSRGYIGPKVHRTSNQAGFVGAGHRVGTSRRSAGKHIRRNVDHARGHQLNRGRSNSNNFGRRNGLRRGQVINHRNHGQPSWQRFFNRNAWFNGNFRDRDFKKNRKRNRRYARNGNWFDTFGRFDRFDRRRDHADSDSDYRGHGRYRGYNGRHR